MSWSDQLNGIISQCQVDSWDSYGANGVTPVSIAAAKRICRSLIVVPTCEGGIEVSLGDENMAVTIGPDGNVTEVFLSTSDLDEFIRKAPIPTRSPETKEQSND